MVPTQAIFPIDFTCTMTSRFSQNLYSGAILKVKILGFHHGPLQKICVALLLSDPCRGVLSLKMEALQSVLLTNMILLSRTTYFV